MRTLIAERYARIFQPDKSGCPLTNPQMPDLFDVAARATINARCAPAYLHDVRGSMQALYSAMELLSRSARSGGDNAAKVERACDLAKRAIGSHEKSTLGLFELLTSTNAVATVFDLHQLTAEATHLLRNDSAIRSVELTPLARGKPFIDADRSNFQILLVGLLTAAIDTAEPGSELLIEVEQDGELAIVSLGSTAGYDETLATTDVYDPHASVQPHQLTFLFARKYLSAGGGQLALGHARNGQPNLQIRYPSVTAQNRG